MTSTPQTPGVVGGRLSRDQIAENFADLHPVLRIIGLVLKNLCGLVFVLMGIVMIFVPGQGLLTILLGLAMLNFPGKRAAELALVRYPPVQKSINWIRKKSQRPPLRIPPAESDGSTD